MQSAIKTERVKGGTIARNSKTGRLVSVQSKSGTKRSSSTSVLTMQEIVEKRKDALMRLSDR